jgi:hypothetical protein
MAEKHFSFVPQKQIQHCSGSPSEQALVIVRPTPLKPQQAVERHLFETDGHVKSSQTPQNTLT